MKHGWMIVMWLGCAHEKESRTGPAPQALRETAAKVVLCQTTEAELRALGPPYRDGRIAQGRILSWLPSTDQTHYLAVLLRGSLVVDVYFDVPSEATWIPADHCPP